MIPTLPSFDIRDSSFFKRRTQLPTPKEVRAQAELQHLAGVNLDCRKALTAPYVRPPPVLFKDMGLFVKWGSAVQISEAQSLHAIRQSLGGDFPISEVLRVAHRWTWDKLGHDSRIAICYELRTTYDHLRHLKQDPLGKFIGNVARAPLYDRVLHI
ncbi:hypothetical protein ASPZODRAFT_1452335 [Penicilliopsis zonata CBS 506.65]|uniref:Uncharacterized protein n=1 Tax=Penicilliopsis zonata CBS 506.65 TaxID=1073090 RepID=A0A1L9SQF2_9EURO|nr:hypothetical protein ASPZODRAFT_1452335 [Penicilliopsis zonata CBS 506.65]OJJ49313.1 hypothetical protein ASPZODRAFT_1452335 [Penicilliopsis zonata CBS 506.65]